jgi:hypothetical protein
MTEPGELSDAELRERALAWCRQALQGALHARGYAHEYESQVGRRDRALTTLHAPLEIAAPAERPRPLVEALVRV